MSISFFARPCFLGSLYPGMNYEPYPIRLSSEIRAEAIANYLGGKYNPTDEEAKDDLKIYVKPKKLDMVKAEDWLDIADGHYFVEPLKERPDVRIICSSQSAYEYLKRELPNHIVLIHQQHLNWERAKRERTDITTCGYIGGPSPIATTIYDDLRERLKKIGFKLITCFNYKNRQDAVNFYKSIDIMIIGGSEHLKGEWVFGAPTKMINAASFGIPSVANWQIGFREFEGFYVPVRSTDQLIEEVRELKNPTIYDYWSKRAEKEAEKYHISNVANNYLKLI